MRTYKICFTTREDRLTTIVGLLSGEVQHLSVSQIDGPTKTTNGSQPGRRRRGETPAVDTRMGRMLLEAYKGKEKVRLTEIIEWSLANGFAVSSASALVSKMIKQKAAGIERLEKGLFNFPS